MRGLEQRVHRCGMHGGEGGGGGGAIAQQFVAEEVGDLCGVSRVGEAALGGKVYFSSHSSNCSPWLAMMSVCG